MENLVTLSTELSVGGNLGVYEIDSGRLARRAYPGQSEARRLIEQGRLLAMRSGGVWYDHRPARGAWSVRITDPKEVLRFESFAKASN